MRYPFSLKRVTFPLFLTLTFATSCLKDKLENIENIRYEPSVAFPLGKAGFVLGNYISDDSLFTVDENGFISIFYREDSITSLALDEFLRDLTDEWSSDYSESTSIGDIELESYMKEAEVALSGFLGNFDDPALEQFFYDNDGGTAVIPSFEEEVNLTADVSIFDEFGYVDVISGTLTITANNGFPFPLEDLELIIKDKVTGEVVEHITEDFLGADQLLNKVIDLSGKTIYNRLAVEVPILKTSGTSSPVQIDLEALLAISVEIEDVRVAGGEVKVPPTSFQDLEGFIDFEVNEGGRLKEVALKRGRLSYNIQSGLNIPLSLDVIFQGITRGGNPLVEHFDFTGSASGTINLDNTNILLDQDPMQPYNRLKYEYEFSTPGTDHLVEFDSSDMVFVELIIEDIEVDRIIGNVGTIQRTLDQSELDFGFDFAFLDESSREVWFENPKVNIFYENSFGVPMEADLEIQARGAFGNSVELTSPKFILAYPNMQQIGQSVNGNYLLNTSNSNLKSVLSIYPEAITYGGEVTVNPTGSNIDNHITPDSRLKVGIEMELPLKLSAEKLVFKDTISDEPLSDNPEEVIAATLLIDYKNEFPFEGVMTLQGKTTENEILEIIKDLELEAAPVNNHGKVTGSKEDRLIMELTEEEINSLFKSSELYLVVTMSTTGEGQAPVALYTNNGLEIGVGVKAEMRIE